MFGLATMLRHEAERAGRRFVRKFSALIFGGMLCVIAFGFLLAAGFLWLLTKVDAITACLIFAVILLFIAAVVFAVLMRRDQRTPTVRMAAPPPPPPAAAPSVDPARLLLGVLPASRLSASTVLQLAASALLIGIAAGRRAARK